MHGIIKVRIDINIFEMHKFVIVLKIRLLFSGIRMYGHSSFQDKGI